MILALILLLLFVPTGIYITILFYTDKLQFFWHSYYREFSWEYAKDIPGYAFSLKWSFNFGKLEVKRVK